MTNATASIDPVLTLTLTTAEDAVLIVWLGGLDVPVAYWPDSDEAACLDAVEEWITREEAEFTAQDTDDGPEATEARVARFMDAISIERVKPTERLTRSMIAVLRDDAAQHGDSEMHAICVEALCYLPGPKTDAARAKVAAAYNAARAADTDTAFVEVVA
jgi:hypothetical protein